ncbi:Ribonuclease H domain [Sesbania bispinosa]|nr:Ribonuclease H domain [Sesbania bispinosa]
MLSQWVSSNEPFDVNAKVVDFILPSGEWNQDLLKQYFPSNVLSTISSVSTNLDDPCDLITWSGSADGTFTIKSTIHSLHQDPDSSHAPLFKKLNADGAFAASNHHGACGGVFHNHDGNFIFAYIHYLPNSSPLKAELLGILKGLLHAWNNSFRKLIVEVDSMHAIQIIDRGCSPMHPYLKVVQEIQLLLRRSWTVHIQHVMREANQPAHMLATHGLNQINYDCIFRIVPSFLSLSLAADVMGTWFPRNS